MEKINQFVDQIKTGSLTLTPGNPYSTDQLKAFLIAGVSLQEVFQIGVPYQLHDELERFNVAVEEERNDWKDTRNDADEAEERAATAISPSKKIALLMKAISYYGGYLQQWENRRDYRVEEHIAKARREIERIKSILPGIVGPIRNSLFEDMKEHPWSYLPSRMKMLFDGASEEIIDSLNRTRDNWNDETKIINEALVNQITITIDDLKKNGIVPQHFTKKNLCDPDYGVPQPTYDQLGEYPEERNDIFFLGVPRSGKSSALAGILYKMHRDGAAFYQPQLVKRVDKTLNYREGLENCIANRKCPVGTDDDAICFMKFDLRIEKEILFGLKKAVKYCKVNFVELSGETFEKLGTHSGNGEIRAVWEKRGAKKCLDSKNKKLLFMIIDYGVHIKKGVRWDKSDKQDQKQLLENALRSFFFDGDEKNPEKGCTMSKVKSIAFIMTKCDYMEGADTWEKRRDIAAEYIEENLRTVVRWLEEANRKYGVNVKDSNNKINVIPFSLGDFYVGNTYDYDDNDSAVVIDYIRQTLDSNGLLI